MCVIRLLDAIDLNIIIMNTSYLKSIGLFFHILLFSVSSVIAQDSVENTIREIEKKRLDLLVEGDTTNASVLYAEDFELINPAGETFSKMKYLSEVASGLHDYLTFEPVSKIRIRLDGKLAVLRYKSRVEIIARGNKFPMQEYWHTGLYEKRDGTWKIIWYNAIGINYEQK